MLQKITLPKASVLTSPNPVSLACTLRGDGETNLATVSWWTYLSYNPPMIAYAMAKTSYSGERVRADVQVVLTVPGEEIAAAVMSCGSTTGRNTDKAKKFGIRLEELPGCPIRIPAKSRVAIVCRLADFYEAGDHYLYICNAEEVYGDADLRALFAWDGDHRRNGKRQIDGRLPHPSL